MTLDLEKELILVPQYISFGESFTIDWNVSVGPGQASIFVGKVKPNLLFPERQDWGMFQVTQIPLCELALVSVTS